MIKQQNQLGNEIPFTVRWLVAVARLATNNNIERINGIDGGDE